MKLTPEQLDELLPQTQCGLCGYGGCMPYAEAMVYEGAAINLCPPGGIPTLLKLATLIGQDAQPFIEEMKQKTKPKQLAIIKENECIGCTKCIQVCPVDAILGAPKKMHTVLARECTGCELCVPACPVDCIDLINDLALSSDETQKDQANLARKRYQARNKRLQMLEHSKKVKKNLVNINQRKDYIAAALERVKLKKSHKD